MNEYRLTRNLDYDNPNCFGHDDLGARNGYYIVAACASDARHKMAGMHPGDVTGCYGFTCDIWKKDVQFGF